MSKKRRLIRIKALEVLYAHQISREPIDKVKNDLISSIEDNVDYEFASGIVDSVLKHQRAIDLMVSQKITNWQYERVSIIDKIIIRMCIAELLFFPEIPPKVSINEALEIAKLYCSARSPVFINGVLDGILNQLKKENKLNKSGRGLIDFKKPPEVDQI